jgi:hypothetical protein
MQLKRYEGAVQDLCLDFTGGWGVPAGRVGGRGWEYAGWHGRPHANVPSAAANNSCIASPSRPTLSARVLSSCAVESEFLGSRVSEELAPGGYRLAVTNDNVLQYVYLMAGEGERQERKRGRGRQGGMQCKCLRPAFFRLVANN